MYCTHCGAWQPDEAKYCTGCGRELAANVTLRPEEKCPQYAGFWLRVAASIIDSIVLEIGILAIAALIGVAIGLSSVVFGHEVHGVYEVCAVLGLILQWLYYTLFESSTWQATVGKKVLRLIVTDTSGRRISFGQANIRYWSKILSLLTLYVGFIMAGFTEKKQALHDFIAGTLVVRESSK